MDPNACLERWINARDDDDEDEMYEATEDLCEWLRKGGFEPNWDRFGINRERFFKGDFY